MSIEVITSRDFASFDLNEIKQLFDEVGLEITIDNERMIRQSVEPVSAIWLFISIPAAWITKQFFTGFFNRLGEDAYDNFKRIIKKILQKQKKGQDIQLRIHVKKDDESMIIALFPTDSDNLKIALETLPKFLDANSDLDELIIFDHEEWKRIRDRC